MIQPKRHLLKSITWRIIATTATIITSYILSDDIYVSLSIGSMDFFIKILLYYFHERIWYKYIKIGVIKEKNENNK